VLRSSMNSTVNLKDNNIKGIKTAVQLGSLVRFLYHSSTNYTKRGASVAASGKAFDY